MDKNILLLDRPNIKPFIDPKQALTHPIITAIALGSVQPQQPVRLESLTTS